MVLLGAVHTSHIIYIYITSTAKNGILCARDSHHTNSEPYHGSTSARWNAACVLQVSCIKERMLSLQSNELNGTRRGGA